MPSVSKTSWFRKVQKSRCDLSWIGAMTRGEVLHLSDSVGADTRGKECESALVSGSRGKFTHASVDLGVSFHAAVPHANQH